MDILKKEQLTFDDVKKILLTHYEKTHGGYGERELIVTKEDTSKVNMNSVFFSLEGTPAKGYGIWIPDNRTLNLYDARGKRFKEYYLQGGIKELKN